MCISGDNIATHIASFPKSPYNKNSTALLISNKWNNKTNSKQKRFNQLILDVMFRLFEIEFLYLYIYTHC